MVPELLIGVEPVMQPSPLINPGGDCFACAMLAATKHFHPETTLTVEDCVHFWDRKQWNHHKQEDGSYTHDQSEHRENSWYGVYRSFHDMPYRWDVLFDPCVPFGFDRMDSFHPNYKVMGLRNWTERLHAYLNAGWLAFGEIGFTGNFLGYTIDEARIPRNNQPYHKGIDHFVLYDGIRSYWEYDNAEARSGSGESEIHVVCSVKGAYWINLDDFQTWHGGLSYWLVRPSPNYPRRNRA